MTFDDALNYCKFYDMKLVKVDDSNANKFLNYIALKEKLGSFWIDGNDNLKEGVFVDSDNKPLTYTNWARGEPDDFFEENCIQGNYNAYGQWSDTDCKDKLSTICEAVGTVNYYYTSTRMKYTEAVAYCKNKGMRLVQIKNIDMNKFVNEYALRYNLSDFWNDANDMTKHGVFLDSNNKMLTYTNWKPGHPLVHGGFKCALVQTKMNGIWIDADCYDTYSTVCEAIESPYDFTKYPMTFDSAVTYCKAKNMKLVRAKSSENNKIITTFALKNNLDKFWINGNDRDKKGIFVDTDNNILSYTNWKKGQPDFYESENCIQVLVNQNGFWNDISCISLNYVICETSENAYDVTRYKMTFPSAQAYCQNKGMKIPTIKDKEMNMIVYDLAVKNRISSFWIDGNDIDEDGVFVDSNKVPLMFLNWKQNQLDNFRSESCVQVFADENGVWNDIPCSTKNAVICETTDNSYEFTRIQMTFDEALAFCKDNKMTLVSAKSSETNNLLTGIALMNRIGRFWLYINDKGRRGNFVDSNNEALIYSNWKKGQPDNYQTENCILFLTDKNGMWIDISCNFKLSVMCESLDNSLEFTKMLMTFDAAVTYCKNRGMKVVKIRNPTANRLANDFALKYDLGYFWINGNDNENEGNFVDTNNKPLIYTNWKPGQPDNWARENCIQATSYLMGVWDDTPCNSMNAVICEPLEPSGQSAIDPPPNNTPLGLIDNSEVKRSKVIYDFANVTMTFDASLTYCSSKGMLLVNIENEEANKFFTELALKNNLGNFWIDGNDIAEEGVFVDSNKVPLQYKNWVSRQPNNFEDEDCILVLVSMDGQWNDANCSYSNSVICYKK